MVTIDIINKAPAFKQKMSKATECNHSTQRFPETIVLKIRDDQVCRF